MDEQRKQLSDSEKLDLLLVNMGGMRSDVTELKTQMVILGDRMDRVETAVTDLDKRFDGLETKVGSLETRVGSLETRVGSLETAVTNMDKRVEKLETKVMAHDLRVENEVIPAIRIVAEGHVDIMRHITVLEANAEANALIPMRVGELERAGLRKLKKKRRG